ncbi:MAG TPA: helix-turn-helix domain-containing protein [Pseudonocardiaceae bacterium]
MSADPEVQDGETPLRADARRNRDQIIAAARAIFAAQGPDVPMEEVAREAGVGVGTLYRRFPDREALIRAVARDNFSRMLTQARDAVAEESTAWDALVRLLRQSRELELSAQLAMHSPLAWAVIRDDLTTQQFRDAMFDTLDEVVHAAQAEGSLRRDVDTGDVTILISLLLRRMRNSSGKDTQLASERALGIMLDGLRAPSGSSLPGRPFTRADLDSRRVD